jgi:large subunit ribosomal protein L6
MSRVGQSPVKVESGVEIKLQGQEITVKGPKGTLSFRIHDAVKAKHENGELTFAPANENDAKNNKVRALWGTARNIVRNMIVGVTAEFTKTLEISGVGFKAAAQGNKLKLNLGFSHDVDLEVPEGLKVATPKPTEITITGIDKRLVGQFASEIRALKKPEPYKGKGIKYSGEYIRRKEGKKK